MKKSRIIGGVIAICAMPTFAMAGERALPVTDGIVLQSETGVQTSVNPETYSIGNRNYVGLRDLGAVLDFNVHWNALTKEITITEGAEAKTTTGKTEKESEEKEATKVAQTISLGGKKHSLTGYTVEGYTYFPVRDMAKLLGYDCNWDGESRQVRLEKAEQSAVAQERIDYFDALAKYYAKDFPQAHIIAETNMMYQPNAQAYDKITRYIQEHFDDKFYAGGFHMEETFEVQKIEKGKLEGYAPTDQTVVEVPLNTLSIRFVVAGYPTDVGYDVLVLGGYVKVIIPVGQWNDKYQYSRVEPFPYTEKQLKEMAVERDGLGEEYTVDDVKIYHYFDMKDLEIKAEVRVNYKSETKYPRFTINIFPTNP